MSDASPPRRPRSKARARGASAGGPPMSSPHLSGRTDLWSAGDTIVIRVPVVNLTGAPIASGDVTASACGLLNLGTGVKTAGVVTLFDPVVPSWEGRIDTAGLLPGEYLFQLTLTFASGRETVRK